MRILDFHSRGHHLQNPATLPQDTPVPIQIPPPTPPNTPPPHEFQTHEQQVIRESPCPGRHIPSPRRSSFLHEATAPVPRGHSIPLEHLFEWSRHQPCHPTR